MNKVCLITGTSSGVGLSLALLLAEQGHTCVATMRNLDKSDDLLERAEQAGVQLDVKQLDVEDAESIERCVQEVIGERGRIDVLVNNAGVGFLRATEQATEEEIQWVVDVNFMGVVRCTKAVIPHMREAQSGHIVNVTSVGGLVGQPFNEIYCAAKFAVEGYTEALASYMEPAFGLQFTAVEPGGIASEFANNALAHFASGGGILDDAYKPMLQTYLGQAQQRLDDGGGVYQSPDEVAAVIAECIASEDPPIRVRTSEWAETFCRFKTDLDPTGKLQQEEVISKLLS